MKRVFMVTILVCTALCFTGTLMAQELMIFPSQGQSDEQMEKDKFECYRWARDQTGFDPKEVPRATEAPPQQQEQRGRGRSVVGGAANGGARRRSEQREYERQKEQWAQEQAANYQRRRAEYNRAYSACLEGKGYTVR